MNKKLIAARIETLDRKGLTNMFAHNTRQKPAKYRPINDKTINNINFINPKYIKTDDLSSTILSEMDQLHKQKFNKRISKLAKPAKQMYIFLSPDKTINNTQYKEILDKALKNALSYLEKNNLELISYHYHFDETTPHLHILFKNQTLSTGYTLRRFFNPQTLSELQTAIAQNIPHGYTRGIKNTTNTHTDLNYYKSLVKNEIAQLAKEKDTLSAQLNYMQQQINSLKAENTELIKKKININTELSKLKVLVRDTIPMPKELITKLNKHNRTIKQLITAKDYNNAFKYYIDNIAPILENIDNLSSLLNAADKDRLVKQTNKIKTNIINDLSLGG